MRAGLVQLTAGEDPAANLPGLLALLDRAAEMGADLVLTPEVTNCVSTSRARQRELLAREEADITLAACRDWAARAGRWLSLGSLALKTGDADGRFANRSFLIGPDGAIAARYDKLHMFDVAVSQTETYRESAGYRPGDRAVVARTPLGAIGLSVCYDLRFPYLYRDLARCGAQILTVPSAFSPVTGAAHWEVLLRARAIETGCFVLAAAQTGDHGGRRTWGHSLAVAPWGEVLGDGGTAPGVVTVEVDLARVEEARARVPALSHDRSYAGPA